jgi:phage-related protein
VRLQPLGHLSASKINNLRAAAAELSHTTSPGAVETSIRIQTELAHRVFYIATFENAVYVLHAFEKKTKKTRTPDVTLALERYRGLLKKRAEDAKAK